MKDDARQWLKEHECEVSWGGGGGGELEEGGGGA